MLKIIFEDCSKTVTDFIFFLNSTIFIHFKLIEFTSFLNIFVVLTIKGRKFFTDSVNYRIYRSHLKSVITENGIGN